MAIGFARLEFVKRSSGKNVCAKSAYNSRGRVAFEGTSFAPAQTYDWSSKRPPVFHAVMLPEWADRRFQNHEILWNTAEMMERRRDSQVALDMVLALPDDQMVSREDKIQLAVDFVKEHFCKKGLAAQLDVHPPDDKTDHNWHAHVIVTTRRVREDGQGLDRLKARDLMPIVRGGKVISGPDWGKLWTAHQNDFFKEKGLALQVELNGPVPQIHLGPVRMRGRAFAMLEEHSLKAELNALESRDPKKILEQLTANRAIFDRWDVSLFAAKHIDPEQRDCVLEDFWKHPDVIGLLDPHTNSPANRYTSARALEEEAQALRLGDRLHDKRGLAAAPLKHNDLTEEQRSAFATIVSGKRLSCIEGHAGTGKSYLLAALRDSYEDNGLVVRSFGPDNATVEALKEKKFIGSENIYRFLYAHHHGYRLIKTGKEVWLVDEAGKLGTRPLLEILKLAQRERVHLVFSGCSKQLSSVERGGLFETFCRRYGAVELTDIRRQQGVLQRQMTQMLAHGEVGRAIDQLLWSDGMHWGATREESIENLIARWADDRMRHPRDSTLLIAHSNAECRALNEMVHLWRRSSGELGKKEYECQTTFGPTYVSVGDRIEFRQNNRDLGVSNGQSGVLVEAAVERLVIAIRREGKRQEISFDPADYSSFQLGYATTYYRSQGRTVDRAYVLHSPQMNKPMFYVGLTRHVKDAHLFVSRENVSGLSDLKRKLFTQTREAKLSEFLSETELGRRKHKQVASALIEDLRMSESVINRAKGTGLKILDRAREAVIQRRQAHDDLRPNAQFYQANRTQESKGGSVREQPHEEPQMLGLGAVLKRLPRPPPLEPDPVFSVRERLSQGMESLIFRLFPDGPTRREGNSLRFGHKGSLSVVISGTKAGSFYDFEQGEGGGPLTLIQRELGVDKEGARCWAQKFLRDSPIREVPKTFRARNDGSTSPWVAQKPNSPAPSLRELSPAMEKRCVEEARYTYRDVEGSFLFQTLRIVQKDAPSNKSVLPLSYGCFKGQQGAHWRLKAYATQDRPLYNLHLLKQYSSSRVLIVEGEKAAEASGALFEPKGTICLSWCGGASAVNKTDWAPLSGRNVVIWPDNDTAGMEASDQICDRLRQVGAQSVAEVNRDVLRSAFPEKWDLADPLPESKELRHLHRLILSAESKSVGLNSLTSRIGAKTVEERTIAHEVLWRVENRLRPQMKEAAPTEIRYAVLCEATRVLKKQSEIEQRILPQALVFEAERGVAPSLDQLEQMRRNVQRKTQMLAHAPAPCIPHPSRDIGLDNSKQIDISI